MSEPKLPPGPWRIVWEDPRCATRIRDADGQTVLRIDSRGWRLDASPEVLRAIEVLPLLVEAARRATAVLGRVHGGLHAGLDHGLTIEDVALACAPLREALALVDGEGRSDA